MMLFFVSVAFITFSFVVGYLHGLRKARFLASVLAKQTAHYTMELFMPYMPKDFDFSKAIDSFEQKLKDNGKLPRNFQSKGTK
jgi:hypothetical protein